MSALRASGCRETEGSEVLWFAGMPGIAKAGMESEEICERSGLPVESAGEHRGVVVVAGRSGAIPSRVSPSLAGIGDDGDRLLETGR